MIRRAAVKATRRSAPTRGPDEHGHPNRTPDSCEAVTMPAYLVIHAERHGDDTLIEDPNLTVEFVDGWVLFKDRDPLKPNRVALAFPAVQVAQVKRVDEPRGPEHPEPAPAKE